MVCLCFDSQRICALGGLRKCCQAASELAMVAACGLVWDLGWMGESGRRHDGGCENVCLCRDADDDGCDCGLGVGSGSGSSCRSATHIEIITPTRRNFSAAAVVANNKPGDSNSCSRGINTRRRPF